MSSAPSPNSDSLKVGIVGPGISGLVFSAGSAIVVITAADIALIALLVVGGFAP